MLVQGLVFCVATVAGMLKLYDARNYMQGPFATFVVRAVCPKEASALPQLVLSMHAGCPHELHSPGPGNQVRVCAQIPQEANSAVPLTGVQFSVAGQHLCAVAGPVLYVLDAFEGHVRPISPAHGIQHHHYARLQDLIWVSKPSLPHHLLQLRCLDCHRGCSHRFHLEPLAA